MDGIGVRLWAEPVYALWFITFVMVLSFSVIALTTVLFWPAGRLAAATIGFSTGGRNIALVIGALGASVPEDTWLFFAVLQFPIYCLQGRGVLHLQGQARRRQGGDGRRVRP